MNKCDLIDDYVEKYQCIQNGGENINFNIEDFLGETFNTPASKIELEYIKEKSLNNLNSKELSQLRNYLINLSNQKGRDDRLQLRELVLALYRNVNSSNNINNNIDNFKSNIVFNIKSGYIKLNPIGGFADGKYKITNYNITPISNEENIFNLDIQFTLKKGYGSYKHSEHLEFQYHKYKGTLTIKHNGRFYNMNVPSSYYKRNKYGMYCGTKGMNLNIKVGNIKMNVFFKAD